MTGQIKMYLGEVRTLTIRAVSSDSDEDVVIRQAEWTHEKMDGGYSSSGWGTCKVDRDKAVFTVNTSNWSAGLYEIVVKIEIGSETIIEKTQLLVEE